MKIKIKKPSSRRLLFKKAWRKRIKWVVWLLLFVLLVGVLIYFSRSDFWRIKKISCHLNGSGCRPELAADLMNLFQAENILFSASKTIVEKVINQHPEFDRVRVDKRLPGKLIFYLEERKPSVAVTNRDALKGDLFIFDKEGVLLEKKSGAVDLPLILVDQLPALEVGDKAPYREIGRMISLLIDLQMRLLEPETVKIISEKTAEVRLKDNTRVIFSLKRNLENQLDSLQLLHSRTKIEGKHLGYVDLRFDKPVITYE